VPDGPVPNGPVPNGPVRGGPVGDGPHLVPSSLLADLDRERLAAALRPLWEDAGPLVDRLLGRQFGSWPELVGTAEVEISAMDDATRVELLRAHPRIGERPDVLAARSTVSLREQTAGGEAGADVLARLAELNDCYEARFGFPFVLWVAGRDRREVISVLEERLTGDRATEMAAGCAALVAIARDRLASMRAGYP
jgi:2-oxo-4-hydroxy-4-carboxy--5-ureidoimidazoline (OHCU) decarboxylase